MKIDVSFSEFMKMSLGVNEANKGEYDDYFKKKLKKYGVKSPASLSKDDKKKFYDEVDAGWDAENETDLDEDLI